MVHCKKFDTHRNFSHALASMFQSWFKRRGAECKFHCTAAQLAIIAHMWFTCLFVTCQGWVPMLPTTLQLFREKSVFNLIRTVQGGNRPPKTYESNFIHHDFVRKTAFVIRPFCRPLFCHSSIVNKGVRKGGVGFKTPP